MMRDTKLMSIDHAGLAPGGGLGRTLLLGTLLLSGWGTGAAGQSPSGELPIKAARTISFETDEGSLMSLDLSPDGSTIVFDLLGDLYSLPVAGGKAKQLTRGLALDSRPVWSPDGKWIAYVSDGTGVENLWIMRADGTERRAITNENDLVERGRFVEVEWAPDGQHLLSRDTLYHVGGGKRPVGRQLGQGARFTPDGRFIHYRNGDAIRRYDRLTDDTVQIARPSSSGSAVVSPDGKWLVYVTAGTPYNGLRARNLETGDDHRLADRIERLRSSWAFERFVVTADSREVLIGYGGKIHRIDIATGEDRVVPFRAEVNAELGPFVYNRYRLTNDSVTVRYLRSPAVSPDGRALVFTALQRLYRMSLPRGKPERFAPQDGLSQLHPAYSPDGRWIAYVTWSDAEGGQVWRVPAEGGTPERLTSVPGYYLRPAWSPDGETIAIANAGTKDTRPRFAAQSPGWLQLLPSRGGTPKTIMAGVSIQVPVTFTPDGSRILVQGADGKLVSIRTDGRDRRVLAEGPPEVMTYTGMQIMPSPDGRYAAYVLRDELYLTPLSQYPDSLRLVDSIETQPALRISQTGAQDPRWDRDGKLIWAFGNRVYRFDPKRAIAFFQEPRNGDRPAPSEATRIDEVHSVRLRAARDVGRGTVALRGARLITMKGNEVLEAGTVVITGDRIVAVGPTSTVKIPKGAKVIDVAGATIMPGMVDLHGHSRPAPDALLQSHPPYLASLAYGITTVREVQAGSNDQFGYAELIETGSMLGPRLLSVGLCFCTPWVEIRTAEDARSAVLERKEMGAISVKQYMQPSRRRRQLALQAAGQAGINTTNESGHGIGYTLSMVLDGTTGVEHTISDMSLYGDVIRLMAEAKTWYTPTFQVGYGGHGLEYFRGRYANLLLDEKHRRFTPYETVESRRSGALLRPGDPRYQDFGEAARRAAEIVRRGGHVAIGSHGEDQGIGAHWELWALQLGGLSNHEALRVATLSGAEGLGIQDDVGSIEVGKLADLVILEKNPLDNIEHTATIRSVMKNGILYDGRTLDTLWPVNRIVPRWVYPPARPEPTGKETNR